MTSKITFMKLAKCCSGFQKPHSEEKKEKASERESESREWEGSDMSETGLLCWIESHLNNLLCDKKKLLVVPPVS